MLIIFLQGCKFDEPNPTIEPVTGKFTLEKSVILISSSFSNGKTLTVGSLGEELGLKGLELKQNSEGNRTAQIEISASKISSHTFGSNISPVSPLISIHTSNEKFEEDGLYLLKIPLSRTISSDEFVMGFYYDQSTGKLEGIPMVSLNSTSITIATRHFSDLFASVIKKSKLPDNIETGFNPKADGWPFVNYGTAYNNGGICGGMSITAMYAYLYKGGNLVSNADNEGNTNFKTPNIWEDDSYGIIYADFGQDEYTRIFKSWHSDMWLKGIEDELTYRAFSYSMMITGEPQLVRIDRDGGAHAMVVYAIREKQLMIYDPNYPKNTERSINFKGGTTMTFDPYSSAENATELANGRGVMYPYITYAAKTAVADWSRIDKAWTLYKDRTLYASDYGIKDLKLKVYNTKDSLISAFSEKTSITLKEIKFGYSQPNFTGLSAYLIDKEGKSIPGNKSYTLSKGDNYVGLILNSPATDGGWFGFKWFNIRLTDFDENLVGKWELGVPTDKDNYYYWEFKTDGSAVQFINGTKYNWKWTNENGQLKLFVDNGKPAYLTYKIVGNELYFWVDSMSIWGSPFVKG